MRTPWIALAIVSCSGAAWSGTCHFEARLQTRLASDASRHGDPVRAAVTGSRGEDSSCLMQPGLLLHGTVEKSVGVGLGFLRERAALELKFDRLETPSGLHVAISARLTDIDNARERVDERGVIHGVLAAATPNNLTRGIWHDFTPGSGFLSHAASGLTGLTGATLTRLPTHPFGAAGLIAARALLVRFPEPEIRLPVGTEIVVSLDTIPEALRLVLAPEADSPELVDGLIWQDWVAFQPSALVKKDGAAAADLINIAFVGSRDAIESSFRAAGWLLADPLTRKTALRTYQAYSRFASYPTAPVSPMHYSGRPPDVVFQKSLNTVAERHHIRLWSAWSPIAQQEFWLAAATHDVGIQFDRRNLTSHRIDPRIDDERDKVLRDLSYAGCLDAPVEFADRPGLGPRSAERSRNVVTDGRLAVIRLRNCESDAATVGLGKDEWGRLPVAGRLLRRTVLEARQYVLRGSVYYFAYRGVVRFRDRTRVPARASIQSRK